ncbi:MAG: MFS transporter [Pseudomonadota bacterium]
MSETPVPAPGKPSSAGAAAIPRLSLRRLLAYGAPGLPLAGLTLPVYIFLPTLYSAEVGLSLALVGQLLLLVRIADAISDPLIGFLSDRTPSRFGRRKPWMLAGLPFAMAAIYFLFTPPDTAGPAYLFGWSLVLTVAWTMIIVPYNAWGAEMSPDYNERTRITAYREGFIITGTLVASALPTILSAQGLEGVREHAAGLALFLILALPLALTLAFVTVPDRAYARKTSLSLRKGLALLSQNAPFRRILPAYFLSGIANGLPASLFILFATHVLERPDSYGPLLLLYFLAGFASIPIWFTLSKHLGKHRTWCIAMIMTCAAFAPVPFLIGPEDYTLFLVITVITGFGVGADLSLPAATYADVVDEDRLRSGEQRTGVFFAAWGFATKVALALAVGIGFPILATSGFDAAAEVGSNSDRAVFVLALLYAGAPVVLKLAAVALMWSFPIDRERYEEIRRQLDERQGESPA